MFKSFKVGRLYFRFIKGTRLEDAGWTAQGLAELLAQEGLITLLDGQEKDQAGRWKSSHKRFVEMPGIVLNQKGVYQLIQLRTQKESVCVK